MLFYLILNITHIFTGTSLFLNSIFISVDGFLFRREKRGNSFTLLISDIRFLACKIKADSLLLPRAATKSEVQLWLLGRDHSAPFLCQELAAGMGLQAFFTASQGALR